MTRRLEAGPLLVTLGALLLLVSLFLNWFTGEITAWQAFEVWDLVLFVLALGAIAAGLGLTTEDADMVDRRFLPGAVAAVAVIVASQIIDPPPAATGQDPDTGAWLALGGALVMCAGAVLTFGRVHLALTVDRREPRHVAAVDARGPQDPTTDSIPAVRPAEREPGTSGRLFGRDRTPEAEPSMVAGARARSERGAGAPAGKQAATAPAVGDAEATEPAPGETGGRERPARKRGSTPRGAGKTDATTALDTEAGKPPAEPKQD